jgi:hypothetical protein
MEFMARLAAITCPPRYPLTRFAGVLAPRSKWRRDVVPKPREKRDACGIARSDKPGAATRVKGDGPKTSNEFAQRPTASERNERADGDNRSHRDGLATISIAPPPRGEVIMLSPNVTAVRHWDRLIGGLLYATAPRVDWATLLHRSFAVDVLECPKCHGRLRVLAVITELTTFCIQRVVVCRRPLPVAPASR